MSKIPRYVASKSKSSSAIVPKPDRQTSKAGSPAHHGHCRDRERLVIRRKSSAMALDLLPISPAAACHPSMKKRFKLKLGQRVCIAAGGGGGGRGTLRYIGPLLAKGGDGDADDDDDDDDDDDEEKEEEEDVYCGVELNRSAEDGRGGDGWFDGRKYFDCAVGRGVLVPLKLVEPDWAEFPSSPSPTFATAAAAGDGDGDDDDVTAVADDLDNNNYEDGDGDGGEAAAFSSASRMTKSTTFVIERIADAAGSGCRRAGDVVIGVSKDVVVQDVEDVRYDHDYGSDEENAELMAEERLLLVARRAAFQHSKPASLVTRTKTSSGGSSNNSPPYAATATDSEDFDLLASPGSAIPDDILNASFSTCDMALSTILIESTKHFLQKQDACVGTSAENLAIMSPTMERINDKEGKTHKTADVSIQAELELIAGNSGNAATSDAGATAIGTKSSSCVEVKAVARQIAVVDPLHLQVQQKEQEDQLQEVTTSITSVTSLDGYQGDGEDFANMADSRELPSGPTNGTVANELVLSEPHPPSLALRSARVIDGRLYLPLDCCALWAPGHNDSQEPGRRQQSCGESHQLLVAPRMAPSMLPSHELDSSGVYSEAEFPTSLCPRSRSGSSQHDGLPLSSREQPSRTILQKTNNSVTNRKSLAKSASTSRVPNPRSKYFESRLPEYSNSTSRPKQTTSKNSPSGGIANKDSRPLTSTPMKKGRWDDVMSKITKERPRKNVPSRISQQQQQRSGGTRNKYSEPSGVDSKTLGNRSRRTPGSSVGGSASSSPAPYTKYSGGHNRDWLLGHQVTDRMPNSSLETATCFCECTCPRCCVSYSSSEPPSLSYIPTLPSPSGVAGDYVPCEDQITDSRASSALSEHFTPRSAMGCEGQIRATRQLPQGKHHAGYSRLHRKGTAMPTTSMIGAHLAASDGNGPMSTSGGASVDSGHAAGGPPPKYARASGKAGGQVSLRVGAAASAPASARGASNNFGAGGNNSNNKIVSGGVGRKVPAANSRLGYAGSAAANNGIPSAASGLKSRANLGHPGSAAASVVPRSGVNSENRRGIPAKVPVGKFATPMARHQSLRNGNPASDGGGGGGGSAAVPSAPSVPPSSSLLKGKIVSNGHHNGSLAGHQHQLGGGRPLLELNNNSSAPASSASPSSSTSSLVNNVVNGGGGGGGRAHNKGAAVQLGNLRLHNHRQQEQQAAATTTRGRHQHHLAAQPPAAVLPLPPPSPIDDDDGHDGRRVAAFADVHVHVDAAATAAAAVPRACAGCAAKDAVVERLSNELRHAGKGAEALAVVVQHLAHSVDGFAAPGLKRRLSAADLLLRTSEKERLEMRGQIHDMVVEHNAVVARLQDNLLAENERRIREVVNAAEQRMDAVRAEHAAEVTRVATDLAQARHELGLKSAANAELEDKLRALAEERDVLHAQVHAKDMTIQQRVDVRVKAVKDQCTALQNEVDSLRSVDEMRKAEVAALRKDQNLWSRREEELRDSQDCVRRMKAELEEKRSKLNYKEEQEKDWMQQRHQMIEQINRLTNDKTRLSFELEELRYKVQFRNTYTPDPGARGNGNSRSGTPIDSAPAAPSPYVPKRSNSLKGSPSAAGRDQIVCAAANATGGKRGICPPHLSRLVLSSERDQFQPLDFLSSSPPSTAPAAVAVVEPGFSSGGRTGGGGGVVDCHPALSFNQQFAPLSPSSPFPPPSSSVPDSPGMTVIAEKEAGMSFIVRLDDVDAGPRVFETCFPGSRGGTPQPSPSSSTPFSHHQHHNHNHHHHPAVRAVNSVPNGGSPGNGGEAGHLSANAGGSAYNKRKVRGGGGGGFGGRDSPQGQAAGPKSKKSLPFRLGYEEGGCAEGGSSAKNVASDDLPSPTSSESSSSSVADAICAPTDASLQSTGVEGGGEGLVSFGFSA